MNPVKWSIDQMYATMNDIQSRANAERLAMLSNRATLAQVATDLAQIPGPPAPMGSPWNPLTEPTARQAHIESVYARGAKQIADLVGRFKAFLASHGITPSDGLGNLGAFPLVPVAIVTVALVALAVVAWLHEANGVQARALTLQQHALAALLGGQMSSADYQATVTSSEREATAAVPRDPWGLTGLVEALVPLGIVVAVLLLGPPLVRSLSSRQRAVA